MFIAILFVIAKTCKQVKCPSTGELDKLVYAYNGKLLDNKKEWIAYKTKDESHNHSEWKKPDTQKEYVLNESICINL